MTASTAARQGEAIEAGGYLTDGLGLFRVVSALAVPMDEGWVELENCLTLEARWYTQRQVQAMSLRRVFPTTNAAPARS